MPYKLSYKERKQKAREYVQDRFPELFTPPEELTDEQKIQKRSGWRNQLKAAVGRPPKKLRHRDALMDQIEEQYLAVIPDLRVDHPGLYSGGKYTPGDKIAAVMAYRASGTAVAASKYCGVPANVISQWKRESDWWPEIMRQVRKEKDDLLDNTYSAIVEAGTNKLMERVQFGDARLDMKTGEVHYQPVSARDLAIVIGTIQDKRSLLRGDPTSIKAEMSFEERQEKLKTTFREIAEKKGILIEGEKDAS